MIIRNLATDTARDARIFSATVVWEEQNFPEQALTFAIHDGDSEHRPGEIGEPSADPFLAGCFPLAAIHGEARVRIEGRPCPMLVEGLLTAHAWWTSWGGMPTPAPRIEAACDQARPTPGGPRRAIGFISGGVDGLHMLMRNRRLYRKADPAYIRDVLFIHGFDIGKRARDPEIERYRATVRRLEPVAAEAGVRLIQCRTNLRHLPSKPGFWLYRHNGAALASVGHAAAQSPIFLFLAATYSVSNCVPTGSHPSVDGLFSSQRVTLIHDGARFSRVDKVREIASWPAALAALRVCSANVGNQVNCGRCEKCLRTRLELLAAGVEETAAFGPSLTPVELWEEAVPAPIADSSIHHEELLPALRARGLDALCRVLEDKIRAYRDRLQKATRCPGF